MAEVILVDCATCGEEQEIFDDDEYFNCPYCHNDNVLVDADDEFVEERSTVEKTGSDLLVLNRSILSTWCSKHKEQTEHGWVSHSRTGTKLMCLVCWPSKRPKHALVHVKEEV